METNEATEELKWDDPWLSEAMTKEFPADKLAKGMKLEMDNMDYFQVYSEVTANSLTNEELQEVIGTRFHNSGKGTTSVVD